MLELLLTLCLPEPEGCVDRRLPMPEAQSLAACEAAGEARARAWAADRPDVSLRDWRCREGAPAPALGLTEVAPGVHVHPGEIATPTPGNRGDVANIGFIIGRNAVAVIDSGGSRAVAEDLLTALRQVTDKPVRWLILTHMHPDHTLGAEVFREAGATIVGHARLPPALEARRRTYENNFRRLLGDRAFAGTRVVLPDETVQEAREIDLGGRALELHAHPTAHTDNDLTVFDRRTGTWWVGDLVFAEHTPALDGSLTGWIDLLETMRDRPADRIVPGHGPASLPWPEGGEATADYLAALAAQTRAAIARGDTMGEAMRSVGADQRPHWRLFDEYNPRNAAAAFQELEWE
jgi:quinoprotein relay system zinc metallohydrolase 2